MLSPPVQPVAASVIKALRGATHSRHARLSAIPAMSRLFDPAYTITEYQSHLGRLLGLFEPLEQAVACAADVGDPLRCVERSSALREDLTIMGATPSDIDALERCRWLPRIEPAGLYGYAYVILGSMMGGKIIVKRLRTILGPAASFHFYGDGNGRSESLWASFCSDLEKNGKDDKEAICATAVGIFDAYASWLSEPILQKGNR
jgi:heme oxygenase